MNASTSPTTTGWQRFASASVRTFHAYGNWLVSISWTRFFLLALLLLIATGILRDSLPTWTTTEVIEGEAASAPVPPKPPKPAKTPSIRIETAEPAASAPSRGGVSISIDERGVRITPTPATPAAPAASGAASAPSAGVEIRLPAGVTSREVLDAVAEAKRELESAIEEARIEAEVARNEAEVAAGTKAQAGRTRTITHSWGLGPGLMNLAFAFIVASAILKITYKGTVQAEVRAAQAKETADAESLKRQVVEARMAAMQAQVEPHFLFNTLASIDHLIETDPQRASVMQKHLIALLRAAMPTMREANGEAGGVRDLGSELAVIRPYLEILKVRMEERLATELRVPDGLLSAEFPPMMLQSLVENAIKHGLEPKAEGGALSVAAEIVHGKLAVTVADTGLGFGKAATAGTGIGLSNIRERLQLLYGNKATLTVAENKPTGTVVTITVPYQARTAEGASA
jgi:hypothetical protein